MAEGIAERELTNRNWDQEDKTPESEEILTRELKEDAANFEAESYRACPVASIYQSSSSQDLLLKTQKEYKEILLKNYQI